MRKQIFLILILMLMCCTSMLTTVHSASNCSPTYNILKNLSCKPNSCEGYEGIYTYDEGPASTIGGAVPTGGISGRLHITKIIKHIIVTNGTNGTIVTNVSSEMDLSKAGKNSIVAYEIHIINGGAGTLEKFKVKDFLPGDMKYNNSTKLNPLVRYPIVRYEGELIQGGSTVVVLNNIKPSVSEDGRNLTYDLPPLNKEVEAIILVYADVQKDFGEYKAKSLKENIASAEGFINGAPFADKTTARVPVIE